MYVTKGQESILNPYEFISFHELNKKRTLKGKTNIYFFLKRQKFTAATYFHEGLINYFLDLSNNSKSIKVRE